MIGEPSKICAPRRDHGFSLVELLVVIGVVSLLLAMAIPALRAARRSAKAAVCTVRCRETGRAAEMYAASERGRFPQTRIADAVAAAAAPGSVEWGRYTLQPWALVEGLSRAQSTPIDSDVWYCPFNQLRSVESTANWDYVASSTMYITSEYLDPGLPRESWAERLGAKAQALDGVAFPSSKVVVFELNVWHAFEGAMVAGRDVSELEYQNSPGRASVHFADGHAERMGVREASQGVDRHPVWPGYAWDMTAGGVQGRDR